MSSWEIYHEHTGRLANKWHHYFPIYDRHFSKFINQSVLAWEIGVAHGGSLQIWKKLLGPHAKIIGIDINPQWEFQESQIQVHIGDQKDLKFLGSLVDVYGAPDIMIDDGGHHQDQINASFQFLYPKMGKNGVYLVEDLHTSYWSGYGGGLGRPESFIERCKGMIDELNGRHYRAETEFTLTTNSMHFYDSVVVFEKGNNRMQAEYELKLKQAVADTCPVL